MAAVMNKVLELKEIPTTWREANITLIPKEESDNNDPKNYRPISLLNLDYKIFAAIIAERLKRILQTLIAEEQAGFLPNRHINDNIRTYLDMIEYYDKKINKRVAFFFADAEKAFDNVNWDFMKTIIKKIDLGPKFGNAIEAIYSHQTA